MTLRLGFNTRVAFPTGGARQGLLDGIELFRQAEQLGYDSGWVYQRHFDNYLASPMSFLSAVGQHTTRIRLGTAVVAMRYEDPILLAEAAGTTDLLTAGRLELAVGTGQGDYDAAFGRTVDDGRAEAQRRLARFLQAVRGEVVGHVDSERAGVPVGTELRVRPHSEGLLDRLWYGGASLDGALRTAAQGLNLLMGTIITDRVDTTFGDYHARAIAAYREAYAGSGVPRAGVSRSVLPATTPELARLYRAYDEERRTLGPAASRPQGALAPSGFAAQGPAPLPGAAAQGPAPGPGHLAAQGPAPLPFTMSPVDHGTPAQVVEALLADPGISAADELVLFLPPGFDLRQNLRLLEDVAATVAPHLGWQGATAA